MGKAKWDPKAKGFVYIGDFLPDILKPYQSEDFSWSRWQEDELNGSVSPTTVLEQFKPRPHQLEAAKKIATAAKGGWRGFLQGDATGLGKTFANILGAYGTLKLKGFDESKKGKVLIVSPKSVIPHWQNTLSASPLPNIARIVVINYEQLSKLLVAPASAAKAKKTRTKNRRVATEGKPLIDWDIIIADESHRLKNIYTAQQSKAFANVAKYGQKQNAPFVIWASATPAQNPLEAGYLAPVIGQAAKAHLTYASFGKHLESKGYAVKEGKAGSWSWAEVHFRADAAKKAQAEKDKRADIQRLRKVLFDSGFPSIRRHPSDIAGWPEIQPIPVPVALDSKGRSLYEEAWTAFRSFLRMKMRGKDPKGGLAQQLRFRQKSSLVRINGTVDYIKDLLESGHQVAVSVEFMESLDAIRAGLGKIPCAEISGRNPDERESERLRFQKGEAKVVFFTPTEGISLHTGESLSDGLKATASPRATVIHDVRYSAIANTQIMGRCHRDGQFANAFFMYARNTVEEKILKVMLDRMRNMKTIAGDSEGKISELDDLLESLAEQDE